MIVLASVLFFFHSKRPFSLPISLPFSISYSIPFSLPFFPILPVLTIVGDQSWKQAARVVMDMYVQRTHGTYVEQKGNELIWQFR